MSRDQKVVALGAASGVLTMLVATWLLYTFMRSSTADPLIYALRWQPVAALPLLAMIVAVGNARAMGPAIDPTAGAEDPAMKVNIRVLDNTLQQFVLFLAGSMGLAASLDPQQVKVVGAAAIVFVFARVAFWIGYRIHPLYRAFGFASTAYLNMGLIAAAIWFAFQG